MRARVGSGARMDHGTWNMAHYRVMAQGTWDRTEPERTRTGVFVRTGLLWAKQVLQAAPSCT
eukprot:SAG31_NODE_2088_length_6461_cov_5.224522_1_plen_62_part_00